MSLVLTRRVGEAVRLRCDGSVMRVYVIGIEGNVVRLAFDAPREWEIVREELLDGRRGSTSWAWLLVHTLFGWW